MLMRLHAHANVAPRREALHAYCGAAIENLHDFERKWPRVVLKVRARQVRRLCASRPIDTPRSNVYGIASVIHCFVHRTWCDVTLSSWPRRDLHFAVGSRLL
jgi:hypothetical protein